MNARNNIQKALNCGKKPGSFKSAISSLILFRNPRQEDGFSVNLDDYLRLNRVRDRAVWLISLKMPGDFDYFVVPHDIAAGLVDGRPFICCPADRKYPRRFRKAMLNVNIPRRRPYVFTHAESKVDVEEFLNRDDLFDVYVAPHWHLYEKALDDEMPVKRCPRCGESTLPDYGSDSHDVQCSSRNCRLLWCGDFWMGDRKAEGFPSERGWWSYSDAEQVWAKWSHPDSD